LPTYSFSKYLPGFQNLAGIITVIYTPGEMERDLDDIVSLVQEIKPNIVSFSLIFLRHIRVVKFMISGVRI